MSDGIDALRIGDEAVPRILAGCDDGLIAIPDAPAELIAARVVPDVLDRIEFRRAGWQRQNSDIIRHAQSLSLLMPFGAITDQYLQRFSMLMGPAQRARTACGDDARAA